MDGIHIQAAQTDPKAAGTVVDGHASPPFAIRAATMSGP